LSWCTIFSCGKFVSYNIENVDIQQKKVLHYGVDVLIYRHYFNVLKLQHVWTMGEVQQMVTMDQHKNLVTTMMMKKEQKNSRETKSTKKTPKHEFCSK
jgi:hypothetical protein